MRKHTTQASIIHMNFDGLFTALSSGSSAKQNTSYPYYRDPTQGYSTRTQITGDLYFIC